MAAMEWILDPIGPLIALDKAILARIGPTTTKARVEIDLSRPKLKEIEVALVDCNREIVIFNQQNECESVRDATTKNE